MSIETCICKHLKIEHRFKGFFFGEGSICEASCKLTDEIGYQCRCLGFKLDNLRFVEDLAREKGLV